MAKIEKDQNVVQSVVVGYRCDQCGKEDDEAKDWATVQHHHSGWGNDSCESYKDFDLCSPACYLAQLKASAKQVGDEWGAEVDGQPVAFTLALLAHIESQIEEAAHRMRLNYEP